MTTIVIMPGGFHPFHAGHAALYQSAQRAFPDAEVFVAATNDTSTRPFPFPVKEKLAKLAGVEPGHFVQVKSPFRAEEITAGFDPARDTLIFVRSEKDSTKPPQPGGVKKDGSPAYLQPLLGAKRLEPFAKHAYMAYLPTVEFGPGMTSATEIRSAWPQLNDKRKTALVMSLYPRTQGNVKLAATVVGLLDAAIGSEQGVAEAFDKPYRSKTEKSESGSFDVLAKLPDGTNLSIMFNNNGNDEWQVEFYRNNSQEVTGEGDAQRIFATVLNAIQKFITKHKPAHLTFAASKETDPSVYYEPGEPQPNPESRAKLYDRLVQRYAKAWGYRAFRADNGHIVMYELSRINKPGVAEGAPIVVALAPIDVRNPKKAQQPQRYMGDIVPPTKPPSTEKRGVKGRPGQRPMPGVAEAAKKCPPATQDIGINLENRQKAIDEYGYGPLNPDLPNTKFWMKKVDEWNLDSMEEAQQSLCGNCAAFDVRQDTLDCIAQGIDSESPEDAEGVIDAGDLGYCKFLKFKCASRRTCDAWVTGGPLADKPVEENQGWAATYNESDDYIEEKWSAKYKSSINCANPQGFSQKAHCAGRKK